MRCKTNSFNTSIKYKIIITFKDATTFAFVLRNTSNGFYDGWIELKIHMHMNMKPITPEDKICNEDLVYTV